MSKYLMELGASVVISSRKLDVLQKTADELQAETGEGAGSGLRCQDL